MRRIFCLSIVLLLWSTLAIAAPNADSVAVLDVSGSMAGEISWIGDMAPVLDSKLNEKGLTPNRYGLTTFGASPYYDPKKNTVGSGEFGTAAEFDTATSSLSAYGGTEDGWNAIMYAIDNYTYRSTAAKNLILATDEDRDNTTGLTYNGVLSALNNGNFILNAVVDASWVLTGTSTRVLGIDAEGNAYVADGSGGYTKVATGYSLYSAYGTTVADYANRARATGGAVWDLNLLRLGGLWADSFTNAFVDIKVEEIETHPTPEPSILLLLGAGLMAIVGIKKKM